MSQSKNIEKIFADMEHHDKTNKVKNYKMYFPVFVNRKPGFMPVCNKAVNSIHDEECIPVGYLKNDVDGEIFQIAIMVCDRNKVETCLNMKWDIINCMLGPDTFRIFNAQGRIVLNMNICPRVGNGDFMRITTCKYTVVPDKGVVPKHNE